MRLPSRWWLCIALTGLVTGSGVCAETETLSARQVQAARERTELRSRIQTLQKELDEREALRKEAADALKVSESAISVTSRRLSELGVLHEQQRAEAAQAANGPQYPARRAGQSIAQAVFKRVVSVGGFAFR